MSPLHGSQQHAAAQTHHCNGDVFAVLNLHVPPGYDEEQTLSLASLKDRWPAQQACRNARHFEPFVQQCISMATIVCVHGTAILTNRRVSELVGHFLKKYFSLYNTVKSG